MPSNIKTVDADLLDSALGATADAIRRKTGDSGLIAFDYEGGTGFKSAVDGITPGGRCPRGVGENITVNGGIDWTLLFSEA